MTVTSRQRQKAIDAFCKACIYDDSLNGTWRQQVDKCSYSPCELYEVRPRSLGDRRKLSGGEETVRPLLKDVL